MENNHQKTKKRHRCNKGTRKFKALGNDCYTEEQIKNFRLTKKEKKEKPKKEKTVSINIRRHRCNKGTRKFNALGTDCYTEEQIKNFKLTKKVKTKNFKTKKDKTKKDKTKKDKTKKDKTVIEFDIVGEESPIVTQPLELEQLEPNKQIIEIKKRNKKSSTKRRLKTPVEIEIIEDMSKKEEPLTKRYNEAFIDLMEQLSTIMLKHGEPFRARAYQKAQETIMSYNDDIVTPAQLKGLPGIGSTIMDKLNEYVETGTLRVLEKEKTNPVNILADIYGVGPKKAEQLVSVNIKTIEDLRLKQDEHLNDIQKVGLKYYEQILERIPRSEIVEFDNLFQMVFQKVASNTPDAKFEIVGSYRRGAQTSGDIDVIVTGKTNDIYEKFINELIKTGIILEVLSRGKSKTLVIAKLPDKKIARRVDFLYSPPDEFPFAILYFTGSKIFNTVMRQKALNKGYTFNEHGIYHLQNKKKGEKVAHQFLKEKDIFDFLGLQYKTPIERKDGRAVIVNDINPLNTSVTEKVPAEKIEIIPSKKTLKKRPIKSTPKVELIEEITEKESPKTNVNDALAIIKNFQQNGIQVLQSLEEKELNNIIHLSNSRYYNQDPILTDNQYDIIKEFIQNKFPNNDVVDEIGAEVERNKAKLPYEMASMNKIKPDTNALKDWMHKYTGPYVLSCKLDGVSGLYTTEHKIPKLYTRGNGKVGQDVSHLIPYLRLPKTKGIVIRGEFIIPKKVFAEKYQTKFANPRNMVAGIVNQKAISNAIVDLHFVAYEVIAPQKRPSAQMEFLSTLNVEHVLNEMTDTLSNEMLSNLLVDWRTNYMYEIDGIIVIDDKVYPRKSGNPEHAFAFKMILSDQIAEAKVVDVIWTPSKDGYLKPRVQIEPIQLGGVTIEYATGFNAAFVKDNKIGVGAVIELIRSGDVIPHIKAVTVPAPSAKMPTIPFVWNDTHVDIMLENASDDPTVKEKNITGFFRGIGVDGLSSGNIMRLIKAGYDTVPKIIKMSEPEFLNVEGFKGKLANKIYTGIHSKIQEASIITLMAASNIFGRGFSEKKMELILNELPNILTSLDNEQTKITAVASVKGMAIKTAEAFVSKIENFKTFLKECGIENKMTEKVATKTVDQTHPLFDKTVVLTGTRDKDIIEFLKNVGANQGSSVSKSTFLVVAKNKDEDTGKAEEARKLNVPIMSTDEFSQMYLHK